MNIKFLRLMHVLDSSFPIGGYTQSFGLETFVLEDIVHDYASMVDHARNNLLYNLVYSEGLVIKALYEDDSNETIRTLDTLLTATKSAEESREGSKKLSKRFMKTILENDDIPMLYKYQLMVNEKMCKGHYGIAYAIYCIGIGVDYETAVGCFLFTQMMSGIINSTKLVPLSQTDGQKAIDHLYSVVEKAIEKLEGLTVADIGTSFPSFEIRAMAHEYLYSRQYMS